MKEYALELAAGQGGYSAKLNTMREYMQAYALRVMHDNGVFRSAAFIGGTALRFLYNLPRFSEDIDLSAAAKTAIVFDDIVEKLKEEFQRAGYDVSVVYNDKKTVQHVFLKFAGLLYEAGLSPLKDQKISIKIELDTNPPGGAITETRIVNKYFPIAFMTYDVPSLFTGKMHALLSRKYTKGRDFFDLGWYLSRWQDLSPNMNLLRNALIQTGWERDIPNKDSWREFLRATVEEADWKKVIDDVESFLERPADLDIFSRDNILRLIRG